MSSFRYALSVVDRDPTSAGPAVELRAKLAQVLLRSGRHPEAREALEEALRLAQGQDRYQRARLHAVLGRVEVADHRYDDALSAFDMADELLGDNPVNEEQATVDLWLDVQLDGRAYLYYWRNEPTKGSAVLARPGPS